MMRKESNRIPLRIGDNNDYKEEDEEEEEDETSCGIGTWRPHWLQRMASPKIFLLNFSIIAVIQGSYFSYLIGCSSTLEKRFAYNSRLTGFILIADNFSQILISPLIGFLGKRMNKATLIAGGMVFISFSCWLTGLPYFIYGPGTHFLDTYQEGVANSSRTDLCDADDADECLEGKSSTIWPAFCIIWFASFLNGVGYTAFYTLGYPYVDDNVSKKNAPLYFSTLSALRLLGPTSGFLLSSVCLSYYEDPSMDPGIDKKDPRWVGAWWIGFFVIGSLIFLSSLPLFMFPKSLRNKGKAIKGDVEMSKTTEARQALKRVLTNPILVFDTMGGVCRFIGYAGYYITQPKYLESQYRQSASKANLFTGSTSIVAMAAGIMGGGFFIRIFKPRPRVLTSLIFFVELFANMGILSGMFLGCSSSQFFGFDNNDKTINLQAQCNEGCVCSKRVLQPVCASDNVTNYFSPCYAGCKDFYSMNETEYFTGCSCSTGPQQIATPGYCGVECNTFIYYITFLSIAKLISSTSRTGNYLVRFRCIEPRDKSFAMGITMAIFGIFGAIPYPLIFGAIADSACLIWEESCGNKGNCWFYDAEKFRYYLHGASFCFMSIGSLFDLFVIYFSKNMKNLYDEEPEPGYELTANDDKNHIKPKK